MSYIEVKCIKAVAALHRGVVNTAIRTLNTRNKFAIKKFNKTVDYAEGLADLAVRTKSKAYQIRRSAEDKLDVTLRNINSATNTVLNLRDDLNKIV